MRGKARVEIQLFRKIINTVLSSSIPMHEEVHYQLHDSAGKLACSKSIIMVNTNGTMQEQLDISHLPSGTYEVSIKSGGEVLARKTVII